MNDKNESIAIPPRVNTDGSRGTIPGFEIRPKELSTLAIVGFVLSIPGLCFFPIGIVALALGIKSCVVINNVANRKTGIGFAIAAIVLGALGSILGPIGILTLKKPLPEEAQTVVQTPIPAKTKASIEVPKIPSDVRWEIIKSEAREGIKRALTVRISRRLTTNELTQFALKLKSDDTSSYERTFIVYLLPSLKDGEGAWASTHFSPQLEVRILGLTIDEANKLTTLTADPSRTGIGAWLVEVPGSKYRIDVFRKDGRLFAQRTHADLSSGVEELTERDTAEGKLLFVKTPLNGEAARESGEHWLLDQEGNLVFRDKDGVYLRPTRL